MNENSKTFVFIVVALVMVSLVWFSTPSWQIKRQVDARGDNLFPDFHDPLAANELEITEYNDETGETVRFEVAQVDGIWSIPSHENYPADAAEHLASAATALLGLEILGMAGDQPGDQEEYGVIDPTDKDIQPGTTGVGMRVVLKGKATDEKDGQRTLVALVIGKEDPQSPGIRYVRRVNQEAIYTVKLDTKEFSTRFGDWIEKDLLKLNPWDISKLFIEDYKINEMQGTLEQSGKFTLKFDDKADTGWSLVDDFNFVDNKWKPRKLDENEQVDQKKLDELKTAIDDLKIVNVVRKPKGLSADLAADKSFLNNPTAVDSLTSRGFYVAKVDGKSGIYSNMGEARILMKDGVEYTLRFGHVASSSPTAKTDAAEKKSDADSDGSGLNRYLMVTARFDELSIAKPELAKLPEVKDDDKDAKAKREAIEKQNTQKQDVYEEQLAEGRKKAEELNGRFADWYYVISESVFKKLRLGRKDIIQSKKDADKAKKAGAPKMPGGFAPDLFKQLQKGPGK